MTAIFSRNINYIYALCRLWPILLIVLLFSMQLHAQTEQPEQVEDRDKKEAVVLDEIVVKGTPPVSEQAKQDITASSTVITREEFSERPLTLPEVLAETAGVRVTSYGGEGSRSEVSIRGSTGEQVRIFLDGIELNTAMGGAVDLSQIPLEMIERIEIYRGSSPLLLGSGGIGGVVDIRTKAPSNKSAQYFSAEVGSYETYSGSYTASHPVLGGGLLINLYHKQSLGNFEFDLDKVPPYNPVQNERVERNNNDFTEQDVLVKYHYKFPNGYWLQVSGEAFQREQGVPGSGVDQAEDARMEVQRRMMQAEVSKAGLASANLDARVGFYWRWTQRRFVDKKDEVGLGISDTRDVTLVYGANANVSYFGFPDHQISAALMTSWEEFRPSDKFNKDVNDQRFTRDSLGLAVSDEIFLFKGRLILLPQLRYDNFTDRSMGKTLGDERNVSGDNNFLSAYTYKIGLLFELTDGLSLKANMGRYYRPPSLMELFGDQAHVVGNPYLDPEAGQNLDLGFVYSPDRLGPIDSFRFEYNYFRNQVDDLIVYVSTPQFIIRAENVDAAKISGHEFVGSINYRDLLAASLNYTYQEAINLSDNPALEGNYLPGRLRDEASLHLEAYRSFGKLYYDLDYSSGNFLDVGNYILVEDRLIHSAGLIYRRAKWSVGLEVKNIGDNQESDVIGYPLPGRTYFFRVEGKLL